MKEIRIITGIPKKLGEQLGDISFLTLESNTFWQIWIPAYYDLAMA